MGWRRDGEDWIWLGKEERGMRTYSYERDAA